MLEPKKAPFKEVSLTAGPIVKTHKVCSPLAWKSPKRVRAGARVGDDEPLTKGC